MTRSMAPLALLATLTALAFPAALRAQRLTLPALAERALDTHPALQAARSRAVAADHAAAAERAARLPEVDAQATLTRFQEPMVIAPLHAFDPSAPPGFDRTLAQGRLEMRYTLFDAGARGGRIRAGTAHAEREGLRGLATEMDVLEGTITAYLSVLSARAVDEAARAHLSALQAEVRRVERNVAAGTAAEVERLRARAALQEAIARAGSAEARLGLAERDLARATGVDPRSLTAAELAGVSLTEAGATSAAAPAGPARDGSVDPDVLGSARDVDAARGRLAEARARRLPSLELAAALLDYGTLDGGHAAEWQVGARVSMPLFTGGRTHALVRGAQAELEATQGALAAAELRAEAAVDAARTAAAEADARTLALAAAVEQWEEVARIERLALERGSGVQPDLLRAEAGLFEARAGLARARNEAIAARARLARASGALTLRWLSTSLEVER